MLKLAVILACALVGLTGCDTTPRRSAKRGPTAARLGADRHQPAAAPSDLHQRATAVAAQTDHCDDPPAEDQSAAAQPARGHVGFRRALSPGTRPRGLAARRVPFASGFRTADPPRHARAAARQPDSGMERRGVPASQTKTIWLLNRAASRKQIPISNERSFAPISAARQPSPR